MNIAKGSAGAVGQRIRARRDELHLTQREVADTLEIAVETVRAWEKNRIVPGATNLRKLADLLNTTPTWIQTGVGDLPEPAILQALADQTAQLEHIERGIDKINRNWDRLLLAPSVAELSQIESTMLRLERAVQAAERAAHGESAPQPVDASEHWPADRAQER